MEKNYHKNIEYIRELSRFDNSELISELKSLNILKYDSKNEKHYFQYVGLVGLKDGRILSVLPKCISKDILNDKDECIQYTKNILNAIEKYNHKRFDDTFTYNLDIEREEENFNIFALYDFLIADYLEYGLYRETKEIYEENGDSEIDWEYTLEVETGYITKKKQPVYLNYHNITTIDNNNNLIQEVHKFILNRASSYFQEIPFFMDSKPILDFYCKIDIGVENQDKIIYLIEKVLRRTFNQRKIRLLNLLLLILRKNLHSQQNGINLYGITNFHSVWEDMCKVLFNNLYLDGSKYKEVIRKLTSPKYILSKDLQGKKEGSPLIPDVVTKYKDTFFVIDAKYYNISIQNSESDDEIINDIEINDNENTQLDKLQGFLPGTYDILKQIIYMKSFKEKEEELGIINLKKRNLFIIPGINDNYIGKIKMGLFLEEDIELWLMDIKKALDFYLKNENNIELLDTILLSSI
ncbi:LlaJI family restriction endonuclease [Fusobacterium sp.]|uniref:LlaJI family restriction endonuclease n=1 Tax=Fusobacterium sp. TaxID=68766 RepID=UPI000C70CD75|nr:LlaJI family restriction endonuclease [Fusobacterium sp.]